MRSLRFLTAVILLLISTLTLGATTASAAPTEYTSDDGQYTFWCTAGGKSATILKYHGAGGAVTVPATVSSSGSGTCDVDVIGVGAFANSGLTSARFDSPVDVWEDAFSGNSIESVRFTPGPGSRSIDATAFDDQTVDGKPVVGWLDERDYVVEHIGPSVDGGFFTAVTSERFTVSFDPRNGIDPLFTAKVFDGDVVEQPATPTPPSTAGGDAIGAELRGWFTPGGERYDFDAPVTGDLALEARWDWVYPDSITVTLEPQNGEAATMIPVAPGATLERPDPPTKAPDPEPGTDRVVFAGWTTDPNGDAGLFDFDSPITEDVTLYALWDHVVLDRHTVTFIPNDDGSDDPRFTVGVLDGDMVEQPAQPTAYDETYDTRWDFRGWSDEDGNLFDFSDPIFADQTLTGSWTKVTTVTIVNASEIELDLPSSLQAGQTYDLFSTQLAPLSSSQLLPSEIFESALILSTETQIQVSGCVTTRGIASMNPDAAVPVVIPMPNPACASGMAAQTVIPAPPEGGPVSQGTTIKLCAIFCTLKSTLGIESTPRHLADVTFDELGQATTRVTIPADMEPGDHHLVYTLPDGTQQRFPVTVTAADSAGLTHGSASLPYTGAPSAVASLLQLMVGLALVVTGGRLVNRRS